MMFTLLVVVELVKRATDAASASEDAEVDITHLEKVLPQFLLDFQ